MDEIIIDEWLSEKSDYEKSNYNKDNLSTTQMEIPSEEVKDKEIDNLKYRFDNSIFNIFEAKYNISFTDFLSAIDYFKRLGIIEDDINGTYYVRGNCNYNKLKEYFANKYAKKEQYTPSFLPDIDLKESLYDTLYTFGKIITPSLPVKCLRDLIKERPKTIEELSKLSYIPEEVVKKYGSTLVEVIKKYDFKENEDTLVFDEIRLKLESWRQAVSKEKGIPTFAVIPDSAVKEILVRMPKTFYDLELIKGMNKQRIDEHGSNILDILYK